MLNGMSADSAQYNAIRVGCSGKYRTADIRIKIQKIHKLNTTQIKQGKQRVTAKQNYPGSFASYDTRPGNEAVSRAHIGQ